MNGGYFPPGGGGGSFDPHSPGPIGDVTPSTGNFLTLEVSSPIRSALGLAVNDPAIVLHLLGWYQSGSLLGSLDGSLVASWIDSAHGHTATQGTSANQPIYLSNRANGFPCLRFNGAQSLVVGNGLAWSNRSATYVFVIDFKRRSAPENRGFFESYVDDSNLQIAYQGGYTTGDFGSYLGASFSPTPNNGLVVLIVSASGAGANVWCNGGTAANGAPTAMTLAGAVLGAGPHLGNAGYLDFYEFAIYDTALTAPQIANIGKNLMATYGIDSRGFEQPPDRQSLIVCFGDSRTSGASAETGGSRYPDQLQRLLGPGAEIINAGIPGASLAGLVTLAPGILASLYSSERQKNILILNGGINDIAGGATGANTYASLLTIAAAAKSSGWTVIATTTLYWHSLSSGQQTELATYNSDVSGDSTHFDAVVDWNADATIGGYSNSANTTYFDGIHQKDPAQLIEAQLLVTPVQTILGE